MFSINSLQRRMVAAMLPLLCVPAVYANDFPTIDRVEFVLECAVANSDTNKQFFYQCACALDELAKQVDYETYVNMSVVSRYRSMGGERGGTFRDPQEYRDLRRAYKALLTNVKKTCNVPK